MNTGTFHCRQTGLYLFALTLYVDPSDEAFPINMYLNNIVVARPYTGASDATVASSETAVATARRGDELRIKFATTEATTVRAKTRFSAVLIQKL